MRKISPKDCLALTELPPVILLSCPDNVRANRLTAKLREIHKAELIERTHLATLNQQSFSALVDSLSMMSLFAQIRLVVIEVPEKKNSLTEQLLNSLGHISLGTTVVLRFKSGVPSGNALGNLPNESAFIELERMQGDTLLGWLSREVTRLGNSAMNAGALRLLAQYGGDDLDAAYQALEQVILFADGQQITEQTVKSVITIIPEAEEFALLDLLDSGSLWRAEHLAENLLSQGSNAFMLLAMIARNQINRIAVRGGVERKIPDGTLKHALGMSPWVYERTKKIALKPNLPSMKHVISAIVRADTRLKGKSLGPQAILSEVFSALAPRPARHRDNAYVSDDYNYDYSGKSPVEL